MIPRDTVDRIYALAKVEDVVAEHVTLRKRGANLIGLCPFHNEKTGSFTVSPSKGIYKCFGCGAAGNAVKFVQQIESCSYAEALRYLAKKYGIIIEEREQTAEEKQRQGERESMYAINEWANTWFQDQLWNTDEGRAVGLAYFIQRGLHEDIIHKFQLGYCPEKGSQLTKAATKKGFSEQYLLSDANTHIGTGLCGKSEKDNHLYDRFRDRVIYPIHTVSGKTVAFAGRILRAKENTGKYVNSPDSIIYSKTNELYGLFQAKQSISRNDRCYLVEGQMDVISMAQAGIDNVVSSGGTALTRPQIQKIHRFTDHVTILYDGDSAGIHAALRGIDMFLEEGMAIRVMLFPDGDDPDSFARKHTSDELRAYINEHEEDFIRFKIRVLMQDIQSDPQHLSTVIRDVATSISFIPDPIARDVYTRECAQQFHTDEQVLIREIKLMRRQRADKERIAQSRAQERAQSQVTNSAATDESADIPTSTIGTPMAAPATDNSVDTQLLTAPLTNDQIANGGSKLQRAITNLLQELIRHGEQPLYQDTDGSTISIGSFFIGQLRQEDVHPQSPIYQRCFDLFEANAQTPGFVAQSFFVNHPDPDISQLAAELISDRYQTNHEDDDQLSPQDIAPRLVYEMLYCLAGERIQECERLVRQPGDHRLEDVIRQLQQLKEYQRQVATYLGRMH